MQPVTKQIAVWLKEIGFDEPCYNYYFVNVEGEIVVDSNKDNYNDPEFLFDRCSAPFVSQALTWLADVKGVTFGTTPNGIYDWQIELLDLVIFRTTYSDAQSSLLQLIYDNKEKLGLCK